MKTGYLSIDYPKTAAFFLLLPIIAAGIYLPSLQKDLRSDAFLANDNPALVYKRKVKEEFGLSDPLVVAIVSHRESGVYNADVLTLIQSVTQDISGLSNINASRVSSLATEKNITATEEGMDITPFFEGVPDTDHELAALRRAVNDFPLYVGHLVSADDEMALIVAEMIDENKAAETYREVLDIVTRTVTPPDVDVHFAGEGAIIGYLGEYVDADAQQLVPFCALVIFFVLLIAYQAILPALVTLIIVVATLVLTMGLRAVADVPIYVITNALPVILIGISVADSIHLYLHYFDLESSNPDREVAELVNDTVKAMWRPVTLTSLTTMAGFLGLYMFGYMPPFRYFGLFAALGVAFAWAYTLLFLPAMMVLTRTRASRRYVERGKRAAHSLESRIMSRLGGMVYGHSRKFLLVYAVLAVASTLAAAQLVVDENPLSVFNPREPIVRADEAINRHLNGTNTLDIVVETPEVEGLFLPDNLRKIEALQEYVGSLPEVGGSVSIVDYLKQMNRSLNDGKPEAFELPVNKETVAQYFLVYAAISDPTELEDMVDYDYRTANIRVHVKSGDYLDVKIIVESLQDYLDKHFNSEQIQANLSGRVNVHYRWISELARSHFIGLAVAVTLVLVVSALLFRSMLGGVLTLLPVATSILVVYAVMALSGITLGMGTSMFAAIAVGLGVDYAIHTLERMRVIYQETGEDMRATFEEFYPSTGKALLFNFLAVAGGFSVLTASKIASLNNFGALVALAVSVSFFASMTALPALMRQFTPGFIRPGPRVSDSGQTAKALVSMLAVLLCAGAIVHSPVARAQPAAEAEADSDGAGQAAAAYTAAEIVERVNAASEGDYLTRKIDMIMTDRSGKERTRKTVNFRKTYEDQKRTILFYLEPSNVRDTGFLVWDYANPAEEDDQWLYLPALRKVRRISASDRGDYFLGTDFTYEDIKLDGKLEPLDYDFSLLGQEANEGTISYKLEAVPKSDATARELGYSRVLLWISPENWMVLRAEFFDLKGQLLKTLEAGNIRQIDNIWTRHRLRLVNQQTGHSTEFIISDVDYISPLDDELFSRMALERGP